MKQNHLFPILLTLLLLPAISFGQYDKLLTERLNVFGPLQFQGKAYNLVRTSYTPDSATYNTYKQEYLPPGVGLDTFKSMFIIYVYTGNATMEDIATAKLDELRALEKDNSVASHQTFNNKKTGEFMIDFLNSANSSDGQYIDMVERSVFRYNTVTAKSGQECVLLLGAIVRGYGDDVEAFMNALKTKAKLDLIRDVGKYVIPEITIAK